VVDNPAIKDSKDGVDKMVSKKKGKKRKKGKGKES